MKYELNTPYDFEVKNVVNKDDTVTFEVEIGGNLFPVKGFPEQIEDTIPSVISCRIIQDKNKNAYLVQNEASYYPIIYKADRRYIFEVVNIKDEFIVLQDKYGLLHKMEKDGAKLSMNEVIVRCVNVIKDNDYKAHLTFYYTEPKPIEFKEKYVKLPVKQIEQTKYAPTVFEEDTPKSISGSNTKVISAQANNVDELVKEEYSNSQNSQTLSDMICAKQWNSLTIYLKENLNGSQIPLIQKEIESLISTYSTSESYWEAIRFFINYDAHMFLATLSGIKLSFVPDSIADEILDDIVTKSFVCNSKLKYAVELLKPCRKLLTISQKNFIKTKCAKLKSSEGYYEVFKLLGLLPDDAILYLLDNYDNSAAVYTIYKFYTDAVKGNLLSEKSSTESFRPSKIKEYCDMLKSTGLYPAEMAACLIKKDILGEGFCPMELKRKVEKNGFMGFKQYLTTKKQQTKIQNIISSTNKGDILNNLKFVTEIDNYYVLVDKQTGATALLAKGLTVTKPSKNSLTQAKIVHIKRQNQRVVYFLSQKYIPFQNYRFPELVNPSTILELAFAETNTGVWYPIVKGYTKILKVKLDKTPNNFDYKSRHKVKVIRSIDFFTYLVQLIDEPTQKNHKSIVTQLKEKFFNLSKR